MPRRNSTRQHSLPSFARKVGMAPVIAFACQALLASLSQWRDEPRVRPTAGSRASGVEARSARLSAPVRD
jgi:hypothetical protein